MPSEIDHLKAYSEACNALRHYSNASLSIRTASVVQGIVLLGAWAVAITQKSHLVEILIPIIGLFFTILLYRFHMGYFRATEFFYKAAAKMEERLFEEGCRPFAEYDRKHDEIFGSPIEKLLTLNAPFTLIGAMFGLTLIVSAIDLVIAYL
ncbi:MAG: hypothetical protein QNJ41_28450 [Xenococcaceae cyanobacterium MO_188.B32]|nr:hypothetical protein [Xenococcaceae cyanobacterium MO_188.B32]